jgi:hypothetical protein
MIWSLDLDGQLLPVLMISRLETSWCLLIVSTPTSKFESSTQVVVRDSCPVF